MIQAYFDFIEWEDVNPGSKGTLLTYPCLCLKVVVQKHSLTVHYEHN